ncbi:hypothetical protein B0H10DRAFT_2206838 [Mycena sp. CBHHK59/15]|nr:hypothetical protein B0H10DRAFT_2206838 [Mycena sp. CBHHK59/15]
MPKPTKGNVHTAARERNGPVLGAGHYRLLSKAVQRAGAAAWSTKDIAYSEEHVLERARERYGLELGAGDYARLNEAVRNVGTTTNEVSQLTPNDAEQPAPTDEATLPNDEGGGDQIWGVVWAGKTLVCVWSTALRRVTTLLPEGTVVTRRKGTGTRKGKGKKK